MNPLTNVRNIKQLSRSDLEHGIPFAKSWHQQYKDSAWIFFGGMNYDLTEGDLLCVFSQYGEIVNINLIREQKSGKSKGFGFLCYEDQRSTVLAVDNLNGIKLASRTIRVDHVEEYKVPKMKESFDEERQKLLIEGCAPQLTPVQPELTEEIPIKREYVKVKKEKNDGTAKLKKSKKKKRRKSLDSSCSSSDSNGRKRVKRKHNKKRSS